MNTLLEQIARSQRPLGTTLVVGAGAGSDLPALRTLHSQHLILAEAHARQAEELARRILPARGEEVWPLAIVATPARQATLHILNSPHFNSLKPPTELVQHYPNLRVIGQADVAARTLAESLDSLALDPGRPHLLILDAPGQIGELLSGTAAQALQSFTWIILRCAVTSLYAGDSEAQSLLEQLAKVGFDAGEEDPQSLYPQASFLLTRNDFRVEKLHLRALISQASIKCETQTLLATQRAQEIEQLTLERDEQSRLAAQYKANLEKTTQTAGEQQKLATDRQAQVQKLTLERDEQSKLAAQYKADLDKINKQSQERAARVTQLENEHAELNQRQARLGHEMIKAEAQIDLIKDVLLREPGL